MIGSLEVTMVRTLAAAAALVVVLGTGALAQSIAGAWDLTVNGPEGAINATVTIKQDGEKITGSIDTPQGTAEMTGTYKGKTLNLSFSVPGPNGNLDIKVNGEVDGTNIKGMIDFGMGQADFTGKKK
jgi:hypothetical protein